MERAPRSDSIAAFADVWIAGKWHLGHSTVGRMIDKPSAAPCGMSLSIVWER